MHGQDQAQKPSAWPLPAEPNQIAVPPLASHLMDHRKQQRRGPSATSSGKHAGGKVGKTGAGGKKPVKVVYISNPMRVKTNAAGFRALVQELTGRHADPSKYSAQDDEDAAAREGNATVSTPDAAAPGPAAAPDLAAAAFGDGDGDEDIFSSQPLSSDYSVFSPPTLLYHYQHGKV